MNDLRPHRALARGGRRVPCLRLRHPRRLRESIREALELVSPVDHERLRELDRGGIRGIVELEVLQQIQLALGGVPIQCFIDLIVGTRLVTSDLLVVRELSLQIPALAALWRWDWRQ